MSMISITANILVLLGVLMLAWGLRTILRVIENIPSRVLRGRWRVMAYLIVLFITSYLVYIGLFWHRHLAPVDLVVPVVFVFGAFFVLLTAELVLQTTMDMLRISSLERQANTDPLTGLFNRRFLDRSLDDEVARAKRYDLALSVLMIDVDHFKQVNDQYGHQVGDWVLQTLATIAAKELRETDVFVRYGGEEFLVLVPHTPAHQAAELAERLRKRIAEHDFAKPSDPGGLQITGVTVSIGVASVNQEIDTSENLILAVDRNLYRAKQEGRNRVVANGTGNITT